MHLHAPIRRPFWPAFIAVPALAAAAAALAGLSPIPQAHAESGRRICQYVWNQSVGNPEGRLVSFVADYKKDGACPEVDYHKVQLPKDAGGWMPPPDTWEHQPVPKITCEEFQTLLNLPIGGDGSDPCTYMQNDMLYAVTSFKSGDTGDTRRFWDLGVVWNLKP